MCRVLRVAMRTVLRTVTFVVRGMVLRMDCCVRGLNVLRGWMGGWEAVCTIFGCMIMLHVGKVSNRTSDSDEYWQFTSGRVRMQQP